MPMIISVESSHQSLLLDLCVLPAIGHPASKVFPTILVQKVASIDMLRRHLAGFRLMIIDEYNARHC